MSDAQETSFGAYARHRGCSRQAVSRAWKAGRLRQSVVLVEGRPTIPDVAAADREWAENSDYTRQPQRIEERPDDAPSQEAAGPYAGAAAREKHWKAHLAELQYKQRAGELVDAVEASAGWAALCSEIRTRLLGVPSKVKQRRPECPRELLATIDDEIREALEALGTGASTDPPAPADGA